jgi:hypothetical protein
MYARRSVTIARNGTDCEHFDIGDRFGMHGIPTAIRNPVLCLFCSVDAVRHATQARLLTGLTCDICQAAMLKHS